MAMRLAGPLPAFVAIVALALGGCGRTMLWPDEEQPNPEDCTNGIDDDGDGLVDCADPDCQDHPACSGKREICDNGIDDDGDGLIDCADPQCFGFPGCKKKVEICDNGVDDDGDGLVDCLDPDCQSHPSCKQPGQEICNNGVDDDGDGLIDCDDPDCKAFPACKAKLENCTNGIDDDGDGLVDCLDPDCFKHPACKQPGQEICNNGIDDDEDGLIDCDDPDCSWLPMCQPGTEICDNGIDDDGDGAIDCDDPDCKSFPACMSLFCKPSVDFGTILPKGSSSTRTITTSGTKDIYISTCSVPGGGEVVAKFLLQGKTDLLLSYSQASGDHVFALFKAGVSEPCNANPVGCYDPKSAKSGSFSIKSLAPGLYYLITEAFAPALEGTVTVTLSTGDPTMKEDCGNGIDDDGDGAIDCADLDCLFHPLCANQLCDYDVNLGSLVVNGPAKAATVNTATASNDYELVCTGGGGGDRVIRLVMPTSAVLGVTIAQQGWHGFGLHRDAGPGTKCNASQGGCLQKKWPGIIIDHGTQEKGTYYYIVDAMNQNEGGVVNLSFKAHAPRGPELCSNGIDDDGDGLIDCMDPDCAGVVGCPGPVCTPDHKTGPLTPAGGSVTLTVDTTKANNDQTVPCAIGGGKDVVIEIDLPQVTALEVSCSQTGDHVLGLFSPGEPRDPCDKQPLSCADPGAGPIGCHFFWGNMQPGKYYIIVEAFKPGSEGKMTLTLKATPDQIQEICDNGIDDDGDGLIDCQDYNCASKPICQGKTCAPEQKLGILPPSGTPVNVAVTTLGAGDANTTSCSQAGGEDVVLGFTLTQAATLGIEYAQFGNHAFAVFQDKGLGYACDAAPVACQATNGVAMGTLSFPNLKAGQYFLVIDAAGSGSAGSVVAKLAAK